MPADGSRGGFLPFRSSRWWIINYYIGEQTRLVSFNEYFNLLNLIYTLRQIIVDPILIRQCSATLHDLRDLWIFESNSQNISQNIQGICVIRIFRNLIWSWDELALSAQKNRRSLHFLLPSSFFSRFSIFYTDGQKLLAVHDKRFQFFTRRGGFFLVW